MKRLRSSIDEGLLTDSTDTPMTANVLADARLTDMPGIISRTDAPDAMLTETPVFLGDYSNFSDLCEVADTALSDSTDQTYKLNELNNIRK